MFDDSKIGIIKSWLDTGSIDIFGRPFAGKDNQGKRLAKLFDGDLFGGGDILRGSDMPDHIRGYMRTGKLIPSDDYVNIVLPFLSQPALAQKPIFLSSVGRWHGEEDGVIRALEMSGHALKAVVYLEISEDDVFERWAKRDTFNDRGKRHDDTETILRTRLKEFSEKTLPVIEFYKDINLLIEIDGSKSRDEVEVSIIEQLHKIAIN